MDSLKRHIEFQIDSSKELTTKILTYFRQPGFQLIERKENVLRFKNNSFFFSSWTFNPLRWKSEIEVSVHGDKIEADFLLDMSGQLNVSKEVAVWDKFIENFQLFLTKNVDYKTSNEEAVKKAKKSGWSTFGWTILIALGSGMLGILLKQILGFNIPGYLLVPIGVLIFLRIKTNRDRLKNAL